MKWLNFLSREAQKEPELTPVDQVHLIVHPGDGLTEKNMEEEKELLREMAARAIGDTRNRIAIVLLQMKPEEWERARTAGYQGKERIIADTIGRIEAFMPENVIIVPGAPTVREDFLEGIYNRIEAILKERGRVIDSQTDVVAYGEQVTKCVPEAAATFAERFHLETPPTIDVNYTNVRIENPDQWRRDGIGLSNEKLMRGDRFRYIPIDETDAA